MNTVADAVSWKLVAALRIEESMANIEPEFASPLPGEVILGIDGKTYSSPDDLAVSIGSGIEGRLSAAA